MFMLLYCPILCLVYHELWVLSLEYFSRSSCLHNSLGQEIRLRSVNQNEMIKRTSIQLNVSRLGVYDNQAFFQILFLHFTSLRITHKLHVFNVCDMDLRRLVHNMLDGSKGVFEPTAFDVLNVGSVTKLNFTHRSSIWHVHITHKSKSHLSFPSTWLSGSSLVESVFFLTRKTE